MPGPITGSLYENGQILDFSVLAGVRRMTEVMPLEKTDQAHQEIKSGDVKFRMALSCAHALLQNLPTGRRKLLGWYRCF